MVRTLRRSAAALVLVGLAGVVLAAPPRAGSSNYQRELAVCDHIQQDRAACIREAGAARDAAARGQLSAAPDYTQNALARCSRQQASDRQACEQRVLGTGETGIQGSVLGGGLIRETVTPLPPVR